MNLSYAWRLVSLSAAVFFLVNLAVGAVVALGSPLAIRLAGRIEPRRAAGFLLLLRLAPAALSCVAVLGVCIPSYIWFEPAAGVEHVGAACLLAGALAVLLSAATAVRVWRAVERSRNFSRAQLPCVAMAGILRPRLIVSPAVRRALTPEQLETALDHERAHWVSRDNLKRLLMLFSPSLLPFYSGFRRLENAWGRFTEWAADDAAVGGSPARSLSLAGALIRVARMQAAPPPPLTTSLLGDSPDLAARVTRLLDPAPRHLAPRRRAPLAGAIAVSAAFALVLVQPATLSIAHGLLEHLME